MDGTIHESDESGKKGCRLVARFVIVYSLISAYHHVKPVSLLIEFRKKTIPFNGNFPLNLPPNPPLLHLSYTISLLFLLIRGEPLRLHR
jgi:hypothetical protein